MVAGGFNVLTKKNSENIKEVSMKKAHMEELFPPGKTITLIRG